jgi:hypothetical protein
MGNTRRISGQGWHTNRDRAIDMAIRNLQSKGRRNEIVHVGISRCNRIRGGFHARVSGTAEKL